MKLSEAQLTYSTNRNWGHGPKLEAASGTKYQFCPLRQMTGSHFEAIPDLQVHTVLPAVAPKAGEKFSDEPSIAEFARNTPVFENLAVIRPPATLSSSTYLPVIEVALARPAEALLVGGVPRLL